MNNNNDAETIQNIREIQTNCLTQYLYSKKHSLIKSLVLDRFPIPKRHLKPIIIDLDAVSTDTSPSMQEESITSPKLVESRSINYVQMESQQKSIEHIPKISFEKTLEVESTERHYSTILPIDDKKSDQIIAFFADFEKQAFGNRSSADFNTELYSNFITTSKSVLTVVTFDWEGFTKFQRSDRLAVCLLVYICQKINMSQKIFLACIKGLGEGAFETVKVRIFKKAKCYIKLVEIIKSYSC